MARRCPDWIAREDIVAAGMLGLIEAADRYDSSRQEPFLAFAEHRLRGAVLDELRRGDILPRRVRQHARPIASAILGLHSVVDLTSLEISETLRFSPSRVCQQQRHTDERQRAQHDTKDEQPR